MRCVICDFCPETDLPEDSINLNPIEDETCLECRKSIFYIEKTLYHPADQPLGESSNIVDLVEELERRIPGLFTGPACPGACNCACNYETGCKRLTVPVIPC